APGGVAEQQAGVVHDRGPGGAVASYDRAPLQSPTANSSTRPSPKAIAPASCRQRRQERPGRPQNDLGWIMADTARTAAGAANLAVRSAGRQQRLLSLG